MSQPYVPNKKPKTKPPKPGIVAGLGYYIFYRIVFAVVASLLTVFAINYIWHVDFINWNSWHSFYESLPSKVWPSYSFVLIIGQIIALLAIWLVFLGRDKKFFKEISLTPIKPTVLWPLLPLGVGVQVFYNALLWLRSQSGTESIQSASDAAASPGVWAVLVWFLAILATSVASDVLFRGLIYTRFARQLPRWAAMLGAGLLYALGWGPVDMVFYTAFGAGLCWVMDHYGSLWAPIVLQLSFCMLGVLAVAPLLGIPPLVRLVLSAAVCAVTVLFIKRQAKPATAPEQPDSKTPQLR